MFINSIHLIEEMAVLVFVLISVPALVFALERLLRKNVTLPRPFVVGVYLVLFNLAFDLIETALRPW